MGANSVIDMLDGQKVDKRKWTFERCQLISRCNARDDQRYKGHN